MGKKIKDPLSRGVDNNLDRRRHAASAAYGGRAAFPSAESSRLLRESRASRPPAWSCGMEGARSASIGRADRASSEGAVKCHAERILWATQASRPWIHALSLLSPVVRLLCRLTTAARPCGTRAALAATDAAARAEAKIHIPPSGINMMP